MKKYIVDVYKDDSVSHTTWWDNYLTHTNNVNMHFDKLLKEHNARDISSDTNCIEFDSEEDFVIFKLKFS